MGETLNEPRAAAPLYPCSCGTPAQCGLCLPSCGKHNSYVLMPPLLVFGILASAAAVCNCTESDTEIASCLQTVLEWRLPDLPSAQACAEMGASLMRSYDNTSTQTKLADTVKGDVLQVLGLLLEHAPEVGFSSS